MEKKYVFKEIDSVKIYPLDYLANTILSDDDINTLLDTNSLKYSIIIEMFKMCNIKKSTNEIIKIIKTDENWFDKYQINKKNFDELENILTKIYQNIFSYRKDTAKQYAQWFMSIYGFRCKQ